MYLIANAMKNLVRNKGRNILIATVTLEIIISTVVTLTIGNASSKISEDTRLRIGSKVDIAVDDESKGQNFIFIRERKAGVIWRVYCQYRICRFEWTFCWR